VYAAVDRVFLSLSIHIDRLKRVGCKVYVRQERLDKTLISHSKFLSVAVARIEE
jgi:hypothetical protein